MTDLHNMKGKIVMIKIKKIAITAFTLTLFLQNTLPVYATKVEPKTIHRKSEVVQLSNSLKM